MSCWREQKVLRMPATTVSIFTRDEWERFENENEEMLGWDPGYFAPSLCTYEHGPFIDYILSDRAPVSGGGCDYKARPLTEREKQKYLPVFRTLFPNFTMRQMDEVHYCECKWYDGTEAPYCY